MIEGLIIAASHSFPQYLLEPFWGWGYQFWSGIGSDIAEITLLGLVIAAYKKHNCHKRWCLRLAWHPDESGHPVCKVHSKDHPKTPFWKDNLVTKLLSTLKELVVTVWTNEPVLVVSAVTSVVVVALHLVGLSVPATTVATVVTVVVGAVVARLQVLPTKA